MDAGLRKRAKETAGQRLQFAMKMLEKNPDVTHTAVKEAAKKKFGVGIDFYAFQQIKKGLAPNPEAPQPPRQVRVQLDCDEELLKGELQRAETVLLKCGIEEVTMRVVDGVPRWRVTEKHSFDL